MMTEEDNQLDVEGIDEDGPVPLGLGIDPDELPSTSSHLSPELSDHPWLTFDDQFNCHIPNVILHDDMDESSRATIHQMIVEEHSYHYSNKLIWPTKSKGVKTLVTSPKKEVRLPSFHRRWTDEEKNLFRRGLEEYGHRWRKISNLIKTRSSQQVKSYAQNYLQKQAASGNNTTSCAASRSVTVPVETDAAASCSVTVPAEGAPGVSCSTTVPGETGDAAAVEEQRNVGGKGVGGPCSVQTRGDEEEDDIEIDVENSEDESQGPSLQSALLFADVLKKYEETNPSPNESRSTTSTQPVPDVSANTSTENKSSSKIILDTKDEQTQRTTQDISLRKQFKCEKSSPSRDGEPEDVSSSSGICSGIEDKIVDDKQKVIIENDDLESQQSAGEENCRIKSSRKSPPKYKKKLKGNYFHKRKGSGQESTIEEDDSVPSRTCGESSINATCLSDLPGSRNRGVEDRGYSSKDYGKTTTGGRHENDGKADCEVNTLIQRTEWSEAPKDTSFKKSNPDGDENPAGLSIQSAHDHIERGNESSPIELHSSQEDLTTRTLSVRNKDEIKQTSKANILRSDTKPCMSMVQSELCSNATEQERNMGKESNSSSEGDLIVDERTSMKHIEVDHEESKSGHRLKEESSFRCVELISSATSRELEKEKSQNGSNLDPSESSFCCVKSISSASSYELEKEKSQNGSKLDPCEDQILHEGRQEVVGSEDRILNGRDMAGVEDPLVPGGKREEDTGEDQMKEEDNEEEGDLPEPPTEEVTLDPCEVTGHEKEVHPEYFDFNSRASKTPKRYLALRNHIIKCWQKTKPGYLNKTAVRAGLRSIGDVNALGSIHSYLESIGAINFGVYNPLKRRRSRAERRGQQGQGAESQPDAKISRRESTRPRRKPRQPEEEADSKSSSEKAEKQKRPKIRKEKAPPYDPFKLIECDTFSAKVPAPFSVKVKGDVMVAMDLHAHLSTTEVIGLLGGTFDADGHVLDVRLARPCQSLSTGMQCEMDPVSQTEACEEIQSSGCGVVGWYHSHPTFSPKPSIRDIETQGHFQKWFSQDAQTPFVGVIVSPFDSRHQVTSQFTCLTISQEWSPKLLTWRPYKFDISVYQGIDVGESHQYLQSLATSLITQFAQYKYRVEMLWKCPRQSGITYLEKMLQSISSNLSGADDEKTQVISRLRQMVYNQFSYSPSAAT